MGTPSRGACYRALIANAAGLWLCACEAAPALRPVAASAQAVIGGEPTQLAGLVHVSHSQGDRVCSGVLIAETLVLTAKHCVFRSGSEGDLPLAPEGFRIGFGPSEEAFALRSAMQVAWIGMPDALSIADAVEAGEDVAIVQLDEAAPADEPPLSIDLGFVPENDQEVQLAGYGLTDLQSGASGVRALGRGRITGLDADTGVVQVAGDSACFGDSGGPVLSAELDRVLGVLGEVGGSSASEFCDVGLSFAATPVNVRVRRLIAGACAGVGGCGPRAAGSPRDAGQRGADAGTGDAGGFDGPADAAVDAEAASDASAAGARSDAGDADDAPRQRASDGCSIGGGFLQRGAAWLLGACWIVARRARRRAR